MSLTVSPNKKIARCQTRRPLVSIRKSIIQKINYSTIVAVKHHLVGKQYLEKLTMEDHANIFVKLFAKIANICYH